MECLRCFHGTTSHTAENQNANRARLLQTRRCRKSPGRLRGTLSIYSGAASDGDTVKDQIVDDQAAERLAALNGLAVAKQHLGSLDKVKRIVRLGIAVATSRECPRSAQSRRRRFGAFARCL